MANSLSRAVNSCTFIYCIELATAVLLLVNHNCSTLENYVHACTIRKFVRRGVLPRTIQSNMKYVSYTMPRTIMHSSNAIKVR